EYVAKLVEAFSRAGETFGAATGKLMRGEGSAIAPTEFVDSKGIRMTRSGRHFDIGQGRRDAEDPPTAHRPPPTEVFGVSGAAAMYRRSFIRDVMLSDGQFLDEDFFTYRE